MASVTVTETLAVNQISVTTDTPSTSVTVADTTSINSVAVTESGSDISVVVSPNSAGVSTLNGLTGVVTVQEAITAQTDITVPGTLQTNQFNQGTVDNNGTFQSYAENPVFHGYNLTIGGIDSGDSRQGITFASSTPLGQAYLYYNDLTDLIEQSRDGTTWYPLPISTTELAEGTNLYYTDARADARVSAGIAAIDFPVDSVNGQTNTVVLTTTDINEGTNLYYTTQRSNSDFDARLATKSTTNLSEGENLYYTTQRSNSDFDTRLATKTTTDLTEGTNLYYTDARADARVAIGVANLVDSAPETLDTLNELAAALGDDPNFATTVTTALGQKLNTADFTTTADTWLGTKSTTNLTEGTNLYYTSARANSDFDTRLATKTTDNLNEGSTNQYFTTARSRQAISVSDVGGLGSVSYDTNTGVITYTGATDGEIRALVSVTDTGGDGSLSYDNSTGVITYTGPSAAEVRAHFTGGTGVTITDGSIAIGQPVATTDDVTFDIVDATQFEAVDSVAAAGAPLLANGEILNYATFNTTGTATGAVPTLGVLVENYTTGNGGAVVVVDHGQNRSGGTSTTAGVPSFSMESTRGTALAPTATGNNDTIGVINMAGHDGVRGLATDVIAGSVQLVGLGAGTYTNDGTYTTNAGGALLVRTQPQNLRATAVSRQNILFSNWSLVTGAPPTQNIIWNSSTMATQYDAAGTTILGHGKQAHIYYHPEFTIHGVPSQSTGNADNTNITGTNVLSFYTHRQSGWAGRRDAVQTGDTLAQIRVFGQTGTNSTGNGSQTGTLSWTAAENFTGSVRGSRFAVQTGETGTNNISDRISIDSQSGTISTTRTRFLTSGNANYGGEISMKAGILNGATTYDKTTELSVTALTLDGSNNATYETKTNRYDGTNYSPTQSGDILGRFTFLGNYGTGTEPLSVNAAGAMSVRAAENFTASATGSRIILAVNKLGTNSNLEVVEASSAQTSIRGDTVVFQDSNFTALKGGKIDYARVFGCYHKMVTVTANDPDTVYEFDWYTDTTAHVSNQGVTVTSGNPTRLNIDTAGSYMVTLEMHAKNTNNQDRFAWIWLAKNGTDLAETSIQVKLQKENEQVITKQWLVDGVTAAQYLEVRFAVDNVSGISLQTVAAQTSPYVRPAVASATITITPVGA